MHIRVKRACASAFGALTLCVAAGALLAGELRRVVPLDGVWEIAEGGMEAAPTRFDHRVAVPGLVDMSEPAFAEVGKKSGRRSESRLPIADCRLKSEIGNWRAVRHARIPTRPRHGQGHAQRQALFPAWLELVRAAPVVQRALTQDSSCLRIRGPIRASLSPCPCDAKRADRPRYAAMYRNANDLCGTCMSGRRDERVSRTVSMQHDEPGRRPLRCER